ncbi:MAG: FprA family A-type flavoprotein, partial [Candidatus Ornithomonoglobus sp.]
MKNTFVTDTIKYIGVEDADIGLFESQYSVPNGMTYNSYLIMDEKITIMDTADKRRTDEWLAKLDEALGGKTPDYLVVSHMEPDHAANIANVVEKYPSIKVVGNAKTFTFISQFFDIDLTDRKIVVKDGDELSLGSHTLKFIFAPMVHWPEVMMSYESSEKVL